MYFPSLCSISRILSLTQMYAKQTNSGKRSESRHFVGCEAGVTHLSIGVIIYLEGLSVKHPKGARSIGIGHPRSGDRCTKPLPYPLDPLWVAEQSLQRHPSGVGIACIARSTGHRGYAPRPVAMERAPTRGASFPTLHY